MFVKMRCKDNANREQNKMNPFLFYAKMQFISALEQRYKAEKRMKSELKGLSRFLVGIIFYTRAI